MLFSAWTMLDNASRSGWLVQAAARGTDVLCRNGEALKNAVQEEKEETAQAKALLLATAGNTRLPPSGAARLRCRSDVCAQLVGRKSRRGCTQTGTRGAPTQQYAQHTGASISDGFSLNQAEHHFDSSSAMAASPIGQLGSIKDSRGKPRRVSNCTARTCSAFDSEARFELPVCHLPLLETTVGIRAADHAFAFFSAISAPFGLEMRHSASLLHAHAQERRRGRQRGVSCAPGGARSRDGDGSGCGHRQYELSPRARARGPRAERRSRPGQVHSRGLLMLWRLEVSGHVVVVWRHSIKIVRRDFFL